MATQDELQQIRSLLAELTRRVYRLEQMSGVPHEAPEQRAGAEPIPEIITPPMQAAPPPPLTPPPTLPLSTPADVPGRAGLRATMEAREETSLESRIGSQWLNRIGIVAVLVGVSYFLKFAFDNEWIGPAGRVAIGLLSGIGVVLWSERFRLRGFQVFSYSLKAVGVGAMYLSLWAAFHLYSLMPAPLAFAAMALVTAATAAMAFTQNAEVLAAFALIGGFLTPVLVSTGQNREAALFAYVALLDLATLVLVRLRPWHRLLSGAFAGTLLLYVGWYAAFYTSAQMAMTLLFATVFFVIFAVSAVVSHVEPRPDAPYGSRTLVIVALLNAAVYFFQVYVMLDARQEWRDWTAWVAVALAAVYLALARAVPRVSLDSKLPGARLMPLLHIGIAVGFLTVAIPLKLEAHWITLGWLVESAVLFWIGHRTRTGFIKLFAVAAFALGAAKLVAVDSDQRVQMLFLNHRFLTYMVAIAALGFIVWLQREHAEDERVRTVMAAGVVLINVFALIALHLEVSDYFLRLFTAQAGLRPNVNWNSTELRRLNIVREFAYSAVWMSYGATLMFVGFWKRSSFLRWQAIVLIGVTVLKVFIYDVSALERGYRIASFIALGVILLAISFLYQRHILRLQSMRRESAGGGAR
ncbi:MAG TPA: DUF2339 domain-containing protein [Clostridia bacterium]|nr:DUF2339 domain-containing protein [Clostridia bacterium]